MKPRKKSEFSNQEYDVFRRVAEAVTASLNEGVILEAALEVIALSLHLKGVELYFINGNDGRLAARYGTDPILPKGETLTELMETACFQSGTSILHRRRRRKDPAQTCEPEKIITLFKSSAAIPLRRGSHIIGLLRVTKHSSRRITSRDSRMLIEISKILILAIENLRWRELSQRYAAHLETVGLIGQRIISLNDPSTLLKDVVTLITENLGYAHTHILLFDADADDLVLAEASSGCGRKITGRPIHLKVGQAGIAGWVAQTGKVFICDDVTNEPRSYPKEPNTRSELTVPLRLGNRIRGVLDVQSERSHAFRDEDGRILQTVADYVAIAAENLKLFDETKHRYEAMVALHEISLEIVSQLETKQLLEALLERGVRLLGGQAGTICTYDKEAGLIRNVANYNTMRDWTGIIMHVGEGIIGQTILADQPLVVNDYRNWEARFEPFTQWERYTRGIAAPLKWRDQTMGAMNIFAGSEAPPFGPNHAWLLALFAQLASIAIKNAELHHEVSELSRGLENKVVEKTKQLAEAEAEVVAKAEQLKALLAKTIRIQEEEQARIAREMHDGVIQLITGTRFELETARVAMGDNISVTAYEKLGGVRELLGEIEKGIRHAIYDLHPSVLDNEGLEIFINKFTNRFEKISGIRCELSVSGKALRLHPSKEIAAYRVISEALQNVATHSGATCASVALEFAPRNLKLSVTDDGKGFDYSNWISAHDGKHLGMVGMRERIESMGGKMELWTQPGKGTRVTFLIPIERDE